MVNKFIELQQALNKETDIDNEFLTNLLYDVIKVLRKGRTAAIESSNPQEQQEMLEDFVFIAEGLSDLAVELMEESTSNFKNIDTSAFEHIKELFDKYNQADIQPTAHFHSGSIAEKILTILTTIKSAKENNIDVSEIFLRVYGKEMGCIPQSVDLADLINNPGKYIIVTPLSAGLMQFALIAAYIKKHHGQKIEITTLAMDSQNLQVLACQIPDLSTDRNIFVADDVIEPNMAKSIEKYLETKTIPENQAEGTNQNLISFGF